MAVKPFDLQLQAVAAVALYIYILTKFIIQLIASELTSFQEPPLIQIFSPNTLLMKKHIIELLHFQELMLIISVPWILPNPPENKAHPEPDQWMQPPIFSFPFANIYVTKDRVNWFKTILTLPGYGYW